MWRADKGKPIKRFAACASTAVQRMKRPVIAMVVRGERSGGGSEGGRVGRKGKRAVGGLERKSKMSKTNSDRGT